MKNSVLLYTTLTFILTSILLKPTSSAQVVKKDNIEEAKAEVLGIIHLLFVSSDKDKNGETNKAETLILKKKLIKFYVDLLTLTKEDSSGKKEIHIPAIAPIEQAVDKLVISIDLDNNMILSKTELSSLKKEVEKSFSPK